MPIQELNKTFDMDKDSFSGYFSDSEITDIDEKYIGSTVDVEDLTKISRQLDVSMGSMMNLMDGFSVIIFLVLIYLLSRSSSRKMRSLFPWQKSWDIQTAKSAGCTLCPRLSWSCCSS